MKGAMLSKMFDKTEELLYKQQYDIAYNPGTEEDQLVFLKDIRRRIGDIRHEIEVREEETENKETKDSMYKSEPERSKDDKQIIVIVVQGQRRRIPSIRKISAFSRCSS